MEQNIKNFDRGIEQKMNEHEVAPPFGMWNRISSELDAMPIAAAAPIATSLIPKRAMMGIIATALVIGTAMITGYLVSSSLNKNTVAPTGNTSIEATTKSATSTAPVQQTVAVKDDAVPSTPVHKSRVKPTVAASPVQQTILAAQQVTPVINQPVVEPTPNSVAVNIANEDVPTPLEPIAESTVSQTQTYYFPPIDVVTPEKSAPVATATKGHAKIAANTADDEKASQPKSHKIRITLRKKHDWAYGNIIR
jgi:hypothetical protein